MLALARKIVNGDADDADPVEAVFAQARDAESEAEELCATFCVSDGPPLHACCPLGFLKPCLSGDEARLQDLEDGVRRYLA